MKVLAASINPSDVKNVEGRMEDTVLPQVPGRDFSGVVVDGPADWLGKEAWGTGGDIGFTIDGSHATHLQIPVEALAEKPATLTHDEAASIGVNFVVAWLGAVRYGAVKSGETVAVFGIAGGVGGAVAQIAKGVGARVIGIDRQAPASDSPAASIIESLILPSDGDSAVKLRELTGNRGADLVFDAVGGVVFETALQCLAPHGRLIEISATGKRRVEFDLIDFYHNESVLMGADSRKLDVTQSAVLMREMAPEFEQGHYLPPKIASGFTLDSAQEAYEAVSQGTVGRVVLRPND